MYPDHININDKVPILRTKFYQERLANLPNFDGFVARWYIPGENLYFSRTDTNATISVIIMDTAHEIKVGVGYDWTPVKLGRDQMQL